MYLAIVVICFPALIIGAIHGRLVKWFLTLRPLIYLGTISYSIYLVHFPLQLAVHLASVVFSFRCPTTAGFSWWASSSQPLDWHRSRIA